MSNNLLAMRLLRAERNNRLDRTDWRASSDLTLSDAWKTYRQALRDLPASASPTLDSDGNLDMSSVTFPSHDRVGRSEHFTISITWNCNSSIRCRVRRRSRYYYPISTAM